MRSMKECVLALVLVFIGGPAHALSQHCVATAAELRTALLATAAGDDVEIRMKTGTYAAGGVPFSIALGSNKHLMLSGGWFGVGSTCTLQLRDPELTVLDGGGNGLVAEVGQLGNSQSASGTLTNFSLADGLTTLGGAGCMVVEFDTGAPSLLMDRLHVTGCGQNGGFGGGLHIRNGGAATVVLRNSLFTDNAAPNGGAVALSSTHQQAVTVLVHNTIAGNTAFNSQAGGGVYLVSNAASAGVVELRNNAIVDNSPADLQSSESGPGFTGFNNAYATAAAGKFTETGSVTGDARFMAAGDFRLASDSPLIDAGAALSPDDAASRDYDHRVRVLGAAPDIGAYETDYAVFADSFE